MTNTIQNVILKPVFTEKSESFKFGDKKKYYFLVDVQANKNQIKKAFASIYAIDPESINIIRRKPVWVRTGTRSPGMSKLKKIAIVTLPKGLSLAFNEEEVKEDRKSEKPEKKAMTSTKKVVEEGK